MKTRWLALLLGVAVPLGAQTLTRQNLPAILGFENGQPGQTPSVWSAPAGVAFIDAQVFHSGKYSARIERSATTAGTFSTITVAIPLDFTGQMITWRGWIKTEDVSDSVALWLREDQGTTASVAFATSQGLGVKGTTDWKQYSISVPVVSGATTVIFGFLVSGTGKGWVDDLELLVDGVPAAQAPGIPTIFTTDHEFDGGSKITITSLSEMQNKNLATLAKVWGFVKYHHSAVTSGKHHWDYELFRILPQVLKAPDRGTANQAIAAWIGSFGSIPTCTVCATLKTDDAYLGTNIDWIVDESLLGPDLSQVLQNIYRNRTPQTKQFFVSLRSGATGNPQFDNEPPYVTIKLPDSGYQLLALFRFWNMVQYFYPNRDIMSDDTADTDYWDNVLSEFIPRIALAQTSVSYQQELMRFIAKINDTHANLWSSIGVRPPVGTCQLPVDVRFVEGRPMVLRDNSKTAGPASGLMPGDVIEELDGVAVDDLVAQWRPLYADSNNAARMRDMGNYFTRGACGVAEVFVDRGGDSFYLITNRVALNTLDLTGTSTHDRPGDAFQLLSDDVAYIKISTLKSADAAADIQAAARTKGLIIDLRNYPSDFPIFALGQLLVSERTPFAQFTFADITNPGVFHWAPPVMLVPQEPHYNGKVVILIDEITQSSAEYHSMAFRSVPGAIVIGSTTAGADGDVSTVLLPGNLSSYISGLGVFYPNHTPTQRVGIVPDIVLTPTIEGIRAGRDELLEEAIRQITGN